jgi:sterol desaturase/sphingolipid hydroxylase (fatty acid hydroxylase superfamily)
MFEQFNQETIYLLSMPFVVVFIAIEIYLSYHQQLELYTKKDTLTNIYFALLNFSLDMLMKGVSFFVLGFFYYHKFFTLETSLIYWFFCFIIQDFLYYVHHCVDHKSRIFWAVHATHHNSEYFNLTTGFRSPVFQPLYRYVFFVPMALAGFHPLHIMFAYTVNQVWGTLVHTKRIKKMGVLEWFMVTPSHHRVHHASNEKYLDKNMGMVLIIWDRIFGTFEPEDDNYEPIKFGLTYPIEDKGPINIIFHEWKAIYQDVIQPNISFSTRLKHIFYSPDWNYNHTKNKNDCNETETAVTNTIQ